MKSEKINNSKNFTSSGFITLLGATNSGKSTLINKLAGQKVSIVTPKVQTTRTRVRAIINKKKCQLIFVDTPGIFLPKRRIDRAMIKSAWIEADSCDEIMVVVDCSKKHIDQATKTIINTLLIKKFKASLILNKIDLINKKEILIKIKEISYLYDFTKIFLISSKFGYGVKDLLNWLIKQMPKGPFLFEEKKITDFPDSLLAAEVMREKLYLNIHQELPYQITVETDLWDEKNDLIKCNMNIFVSKESHKGIVIGKSGMTLKRIATGTRKELEKILDKKVFISTRVKYKKDWQEDKERYSTWGLDFDA